MIRPLRRFGRDSVGARAVEFAMIAPLLFMFLLGMVEYGQVVWTTQALLSVGQQTARCVAINSSACPTPMTYAVKKAAAYQMGLQASNVQVVNTPASTTDQTACNPPGSNVFTRVTRTVPLTNNVLKLLPNMATSIVTVACYPITGS